MILSRLIGLIIENIRDGLVDGLGGMSRSGFGMIEKYILVINDVLSEKECRKLIKKFDKSKTVERNDTYKKFDEVNLVENKWDICNDLGHRLIKCAEMYQKQVSAVGWPDSYNLEEFRIKKYTSEGYFKPHCDVMNFETARRFLAFLLYLDKGEGGNTKFHGNGPEIERKPGRLLMFPPLWMYPHEGLPPKDTKYILSSYLHYKD